MSVRNANGALSSPHGQQYTSLCWQAEASERAKDNEANKNDKNDTIYHALVYGSHIISSAKPETLQMLFQQAFKCKQVKWSTVMKICFGSNLNWSV